MAMALALASLVYIFHSVESCLRFPRELDDVHSAFLKRFERVDEGVPLIRAPRLPHLTNGLITRRCVCRQISYKG